MNLRFDDDINEGFGLGGGSHDSLSDSECIFRCIGAEALIDCRDTGTRGT